MELKDILTNAVRLGCSDVLLAPNQQPTLRIDGLIKTLNVPVPDAQECKRWIYSMFESKQKQEEFERRHEADFGYSFAGIGRFRVNIFIQSNGVASALRLIPTVIPEPSKIGLTDTILNFGKLARGIVLVTGPTGSGKSSTLATLIESINQTQHKHILTIEDPIEFVYQNKRSMINQREVGAHTDSFSNALKYALRQSPDIILVGEMRDIETISLALGAAETGHLCFSTLHTQDAAATVNRIIDEFPSEQQGKIRSQLCNVLSAVVSQVLLPKKGGGRVCAREIMLMNSAIGNLIREGKINQIYGAIESGAAWGMISLEQSLAELVRKDLVTLDDAKVKARDSKTLENLINMNSKPPEPEPANAPFIPPDLMDPLRRQ